MPLITAGIQRPGNRKFESFW